MKIQDVLKLAPGDEVQWNDPAAADDPECDCSRVYKIGSIWVQGADEFEPDELSDDAVVSITDDLGELECFAHELS